MAENKKRKRQKKSKKEGDIAELEKQKKEFENLAKRERSNFVNYRNRMKIEMDEKESNGKRKIALKILPLIDEFDLALQSLETDSPVGAMKEGLESIRSKFSSAFESEDIQEIVQVKVFDPNFHEAVITTETDKFESDTIIKVIRKGYVMDDKVIRPAQVEIAKEPSQKEK